MKLVIDCPQSLRDPAVETFGRRLFTVCEPGKTLVRPYRSVLRNGLFLVRAHKTDFGDGSVIIKPLFKKYTPGDGGPNGSPISAVCALAGGRGTFAFISYWSGKCPAIAGGTGRPTIQLNFPAKGGVIAGGTAFVGVQLSTKSHGGVIAGGASHANIDINIQVTSGAIAGGHAAHNFTLHKKSKGGAIAGDNGHVGKALHKISRSGCIAGGRATITFTRGKFVTTVVWPTFVPPYINSGDTLSGKLNAYAMAGSQNVAGSWVYRRDSINGPIVTDSLYLYATATPNVPVQLYAIFTPTNQLLYLPSVGTQSIYVRGLPVITWNTPAAITYGTPLTSDQLNATVAYNGAPLSNEAIEEYNPDFGAILDAGTNILSVTFTPLDVNYYQPVSGTVSLLINKATPVVTWTATVSYSFDRVFKPEDFGLPIATHNGDPVAGTFVYSPVGAYQRANAGIKDEFATFLPTDTVNYKTAVSGTINFEITQAIPYFTWDPPTKVFAPICELVQIPAEDFNARAWCDLEQPDFSVVTTEVFGTFYYPQQANPAPIHAGSLTLIATEFNPLDTLNYQSVLTDPFPLVSAIVTVTKKIPIVDWSVKTPKPFGVPSVETTAVVKDPCTYELLDVLPANRFTSSGEYWAKNIPTSEYVYNITSTTELHADTWEVYHDVQLVDTANYQGPTGTKYITTMRPLVVEPEIFTVVFPDFTYLYSAGFYLVELECKVYNSEGILVYDNKNASPKIGTLEFFLDNGTRLGAGPNGVAQGYFSGYNVTAKWTSSTYPQSIATDKALARSYLYPFEIRRVLNWTQNTGIGQNGDALGSTHFYGFGGIEPYDFKGHQYLNGTTTIPDGSVQNIAYQYIDIQSTYGASGATLYPETNYAWQIIKSPSNASSYCFKEGTGVVMYDAVGTRRFMPFVISANPEVAFGPQSICANGNATGLPITWPVPAAITYGTYLSSTQLNAQAKNLQGQNVDGNYLYEVEVWEGDGLVWLPAATTLLDVGPNIDSLRVTFYPTDSANYATSIAYNSIQVNKKSLIIRPNDASKQYGSSDPASYSYTATGVIPEDIFIFTGTIGRLPGEQAGTYPIRMNNLNSSSSTNIIQVAQLGTLDRRATNPLVDKSGNYDLTYQTGTFTITGFNVEWTLRSSSPFNYLNEADVSGGIKPYTITWIGSFTGMSYTIASDHTYWRLTGWNNPTWQCGGYFVATDSTGQSAYLNYSDFFGVLQIQSNRLPACTGTPPPPPPSGTTQTVSLTLSKYSIAPGESIQATAVRVGASTTVTLSEIGTDIVDIGAVVQSGPNTYYWTVTGKTAGQTTLRATAAAGPSNSPPSVSDDKTLTVTVSRPPTTMVGTWSYYAYKPGFWGRGTIEFRENGDVFYEQTSGFGVTCLVDWCVGDWTYNATTGYLTWTFTGCECVQPPYTTVTATFTSGNQDSFNAIGNNGWTWELRRL